MIRRTLPLALALALIGSACEPEDLTLPTAEAVAAGNIGCMIQIGSGTDVPVVHTVELLDWATGGPVPRALLTSDDARHVPALA